MKLDFSKTLGKVKPMHAVNNGPFASTQNIKNLKKHPDGCFLFVKIS